MLDSGIDPVFVPCPQDLLFQDLIEIYLPGFSIRPLVNSSTFIMSQQHISIFGSTGKLLNSTTSSIFLAQVTAHHFYLGIVLISAGILGFLISKRASIKIESNPLILVLNSWHAQLSINLGLVASLSYLYSMVNFTTPVYPFMASDYPSMLCIFDHHITITAFLIIGSAAHASIGIIADNFKSTQDTWMQFLNHRDVFLGHLIWCTLFIGLHSFGLYIHNDTLQAFGKPEDIFDDNSIQFKPLFVPIRNTNISFDIKMLDLKVVKITQELGTADLIVHHIHAFTIHVALLILSKGILYARNSRLVSDKLSLGFRYPCDGPGRGGTCQISPWDHVFLALFWMYNSLSVLLFHYFWKMQSDVWSHLDLSNLKIMHISGGDL